MKPTKLTRLSLCEESQRVHQEQNIMSCVQTVMFMSISQWKGVYSFMFVWQVMGFELVAVGGIRPDRSPPSLFSDPMLPPALSSGHNETLLMDETNLLACKQSNTKTIENLCHYAHPECYFVLCVQRKSPKILCDNPVKTNYDRPEDMFPHMLTASAGGSLSRL